MCVVVKYYPSTSARSVYYIAKAMRTRSSYLAGCVCIPRFMSVVSARTIITRSLPRANKTATFKNLQEMFLVPSQLPNLALKSSILVTKVSQLVAKDLARPLVLQLIERELRSVVLSIKADALHPRLQRETLLPLLFGAITQIV